MRRSLGQWRDLPIELGHDLVINVLVGNIHLKELMHADLVSQERVGRNLIYRARFDRMQQVLAYLSDNCCQGSTCEVDPTRASALCSTP